MIGIDSDTALSRMFDAAKGVFERATQKKEEDSEGEEDAQ